MTTRMTDVVLPPTFEQTAGAGGGAALYSAASKLIAAFDELQSMTTAERIITGRSNAAIRKTSNEALAELRAAVAAAKAGA